MKQYYYLRVLIALAIPGLAACAEKEDMVYPKETCSTVAMVQYQEARGLNLVLENGQVLQPENTRKLSNEEKTFVIDGFAVKAGQQILIGYHPVNRQASGSAGVKAVKVNCIVGLSPQ